jgi:hypothetical protein
MKRLGHKRARHANHHATKRTSPELRTPCSTVTIVWMMSNLMRSHAALASPLTSEDHDH